MELVKVDDQTGYKGELTDNKSSLETIQEGDDYNLIEQK